MILTDKKIKELVESRALITPFIEEMLRHFKAGGH